MSLDFTINLGGNFVEALEKSKKGLEDTGHGAHGASKELELFEGELGKVRAGALGLNFNAFQEGGHFLTFDLAEGAKIAYEAIHKLVEGVVDLGKEFIETAAEAQGLNLAVKLDVGEAGAKKVDELAESFKNSAFNPEEIKQALLPFIEQTGMKHEALWDDLLTASTDVATRLNHPEKLGEMMAAFQDIDLKPERLRGALGVLKLNQEKFYSEIGHQLGISEKEAEARTKAGKIDSDRLLHTTLAMIADREGGDLGNDTNEGAETLGATLHHLATLKKDLFREAADSPGMHVIQGVLDNFVTVMRDEMPSLIKEVGDGIGELFGEFTGPDGAEKMRVLVHSVVDEIKAAGHWFGELISDFRQAWPEIKEDLSATGEVLKVLGETVKGIVGLIKDAVSLADAMNGKSQVEEYMKAHPEGDWLGRTDFWKSLTGRGDQHAPDLTTHRSLGLEAGSLSMSMPAMASGGIVDGPMVALIGEAGPEAVVPLDQFGSSADFTPPDGGGANTATLNLTVNVSSSASTGSDLGQEAAQTIRVELQRFLREVGYSIGG